jgi:hypothetical protein
MAPALLSLAQSRRQLAGQTVVGRTPHFVVLSDGSPDGNAAAQAVLAAAEADFAAVQSSFGGIDLPPGQDGDDVTTPRTAQPIFVAIDPQAGGAYHYGCNATDIYIAPSPPSAAGGLVVAEVVEIFEAAINNGWDCGRTNGEALSRALAVERSPQLAAVVGPTAQSWWANGRQDYENNNAAADENADGNGCGTLFLYYLHTQLGFSWQQIATTGGASLGACYQALTGQDPQLAFADFVARLGTLDQAGQLALPAGGNPFPIGQVPAAVYAQVNRARLPQVAQQFISRFQGRADPQSQQYAQLNPQTVTAADVAQMHEHAATHHPGILDEVLAHPVITSALAGVAIYELQQYVRERHDHDHDLNRVSSASTYPTRDLEWIKRELQSAIELEWSTLPVYLSALFSLEVQNYTAYNLIRSVAMEEMVHMAIAANILAALGGSPQIKIIQLHYPTHGLPGGAEPDLHVGLAQLSRRQLETFMSIERPEFLLRQVYQDHTYPTIAIFYERIQTAIRDNAAAVREAVQRGGPANQVGENIGIVSIRAASGVDPVDQILEGIAEIIRQGEGASRGSLFAGADSEEEESHYAKFAELYYGASFEEPRPPVELTRATERAFFKGHRIPWPQVINTLAVPSDAYGRILALDPSAPQVAADLQTFDATYSSIMADLDAVWNGPAADSWRTLGGAVTNMMRLRVLCCFTIMRHQIPATIVERLPDLYPDEITFLDTYTDLHRPVYYGPRFLNGTS